MNITSAVIASTAASASAVPPLPPLPSPLGTLLSGSADRAPAAAAPSSGTARQGSVAGKYGVRH